MTPSTKQRVAALEAAVGDHSIPVVIANQGATAEQAK